MEWNRLVEHALTNELTRMNRIESNRIAMEWNGINPWLAVIDSIRFDPSGAGLEYVIVLILPDQIPHAPENQIGGT